MKQKRITYGELKEGNTIWLCGYRFRVTKLRAYHNPDGREIIRFNGVALDRESDIFYTGYNGAAYGAREDVHCTIEEE